MSTDSQADAPAEAATFDVIPLTDEVKSAVAELGYTHPTPVQRAVFESASRGRDLVVQARTGTGKTAAFGLPLVDRLVRRRIAEVQALILCPTRELALQVTRELTALGKNTGLSVLPVYGGAPMLKQIEGLKAGAQILVGTPGRVLDHLRRGTFDASKVKTFTLDECDEMLSMGFLPQIMEIWNQLPESLQVLLFSATVPRPVLRVAETKLTNPEFITLSGDQVGALEIDHFVYISQGDKTQELLRILQAETPDSAIIFCNTRDDTQRVATALQKAGYDAAWLNADLSQNEREAVMAATRERRLPFLVCTDVAARGIDISHLTHVINYDFPESNEQYVHRTGRTGRAGKTGTAISLVSPGSIGNLYYLRLEYKIHPLERQLPSDQELKTRAETATVQQLVAQFPKATASDRSLIRRLLTHESAEIVLAGLLRQHLAATETPAAEPVTPRPTRQSRSQAPRTRTRTPKADSRAQGEATQDADTAQPPETHSEAEPPAPKRTASEERPRRREPRDERPSRGRTRRTNGASGSSENDQVHASAPEPEPEVKTVTEEGFSYEVRPAPSVVQEDLPKDEREPRARRQPTRKTEPGWEGPVDEVFVNVGRDDRVKTAELRTALETAAVAEDDIAYVRVRQRHTFIGVRQGILEQAINGLTGQTIAGRTIAAEQARSRQARD